MRKIITAVALAILCAAQADARPRGVRAVVPDPPFNGKLIQANTNDCTSGRDYPTLNAALCSQNWSANNSTAPNPQDFDANNYPKSVAGSGGYCTVFYTPSQQSRPGQYVVDFGGNGTVTTGSMSQTAFTLNITGVVSNSGGVQVYQLSGSVSSTAGTPLLVAGMPISISGFTSAGSPNWTGANATQPISSVDTANNRITINSGTTFGGSPANFTSTKITSVTPTTTAQGLNGSGRYVFQPTTIAGQGGLSSQRAEICVTAVASSSDYPGATAPIRYYHIDDSAALAADQMFTAVSKWVFSNYAVGRHLGWQNGNTTNLTNWWSRRGVSEFTYSGSGLRATIDTGLTSASVSAGGLAYSVSYPSIHSSTQASWASGNPADKDTIHLRFATSAFATVTAAVSDGAGNTTLTLAGNASDATFVNGNTVKVYQVGNGTGATGWTGLNGTWTVSGVSGNTLKIPVDSSAFTGSPTFGSSNPGNISHVNITLTVGSGSAITMLDAYSQTFAATTRTGTLPWGGSSRSLATLVYDTTLNSWIKQGGDNAQGSTGMNVGAPYEVMLRFCKEVGAHCWFVGVPFASDPRGMTNFLPELANYAKNNAPSWMVVRYEGPNETWNTATNFYQTTYANAKATSYGWGNDFNNYYGAQMSVMGQTLAAVYGTRGGAATNYQLVAGVQTILADTPSNIANANPRFESTRFISDNITPPSVTWSGGTINYSVLPAAPLATDPNCGVKWPCSTATNFISRLANAQYFNDSIRGSTIGTATSASLSAAFNGGQFVASSISGGVMTVVSTSSSLTKGATLAVGQTIFGGFFPSGVTITGSGSVNSGACSPACTGTGGAGTYAISDGAIAYSYPQSLYSAVDLTAANTMGNSATGTVVNATVTGGTTFTINSITSGSVITNVDKVVGGTVTLADRITISSGTYPTYTLSGAVANQTASFTLGATTSIENVATLYGNWATFANNHNVKGMTGYEGQYSPDYDSSSASTNLLYAQSRWSSNMAAQYTTNYNNFLGRGTVSYPGGFTAEFPSTFNAAGQYPTLSPWAALEDPYGPQSPNWTASANYNFLLKRDIDPASNDNDPMWLEKVA